MRTTTLFTLSLCSLLAACGSSHDAGDDETSGEPAPNVKGESDDAFTLEDGEYHVASLTNLQDGCGKKPLDASDSITQVPFYLTNNGKGQVTIDFCSYDSTSTSGTIRGNRGTLHALHNGRRMGSTDYPAVMDQDCKIDVKVTGENAFSARYVETQRNRNAALREATVDAPECTTSFDFKMVRAEN